MEKIYIVLSRDNSDFIFATTDEQLACDIRLTQIEFEEMAGGRPSVYIMETYLRYSK